MLGRSSNGGVETHCTRSEEPLEQSVTVNTNKRKRAAARNRNMLRTFAAAVQSTWITNFTKVPY